MAKSTRANGDTYTAEELSDPNPPVRIQRAMLGGDPRSRTTEDGGDFSQSSENEKPSSETNNPSPQQPAPTTDSRSNQQGTEQDSDARSTGGGGWKTDKASAKSGRTGGRAGSRTVDTQEDDPFSDF